LLTYAFEAGPGLCAPVGRQALWAFTDHPIPHQLANKEPKTMRSSASALLTGLSVNRFCQLIAAVSLCMICASLGGELDGASRSTLGRAGLIGLICSLGLATASVSRRVYERSQDNTAVTRRSSIAMERFVRPYVHDGGEVGHAVDSETGLPGEEYLRELLDYELTRAQRYGGSHSLVMVEFGPAQLGTGACSGSRARTVVERLSAVLRAGDTLVRLDGSRFAALLPHTDAKALEPIARRLKEELAELAATWSADKQIEPAEEESGRVSRPAGVQPQSKVLVATAVFPTDGQTAGALLAKLMQQSLANPIGSALSTLETAAS